MDLGSTVQSLHIGEPFAPSALTSSPVVTSFLGRGPPSCGDLLTQEGGVSSFGLSFGVGWGVAAAEVAHTVKLCVAGTV